MITLGTHYTHTSYHVADVMLPISETWILEKDKDCLTLTYYFLL